LIALHDLALDTPDGHLLFEGLELVVPRGGNHLVTGPSGSGKTRLLKVIAGVERPARGRVRVGGLEIWPGGGALSLIGRLRVGFGFSGGGLLSNLSLSENLALPLRFLGRPEEEIRHRVDAALDRLDLQSVAGLRPHAVSASARRHANLGRVLVLEPDLVLLDDPLEGLDAADRAIALDLCRAWALDPACTLVIATEEGEAFSVFDASQTRLFHAPSLAESP
jgi:ABC-type transporter Mla maintaining outer membrane lipid asymmetry ATPase subunit MlaF